MGAFLFGTFMVVEGYFVQAKYIPWGLRWLGFIGLHSYSFAAMVVNEFHGRTYKATPDSFPPFPNDVQGATVIESLHFIIDDKWLNLGVLLAMLIFYRTCTCLWISRFHDGKK